MRVTLCVAVGLTALAAGQDRRRDGSEPALYVMPLWLPYFAASDEDFGREVQELKRRLGPDNARARLGFSAYIFVSMEDWNVDLSRPEAIRAALAKNIAEIDRAIQRARDHGIPLCLEIQFAVRERYDPLQRAAEREDRRNMQWHADNSLAAGWLSHSRYARKLRRVFEAYVRALGRVLANRMARYPETLVAASGDGEVELAYDKSPIVNPNYTPDTMLLADYSPFAVAEFRDWLRASGMYAARQPFGSEGHPQAARYAGDASPAVDSNRDGHTLNGDFATRFSTWSLRHFDWNVSDNPSKDPRAIGASAYETPGWNALPAANPTGFDPPRTWKQGDPWWEVWHLFRQHMLWRHNRDIARWITTSRDVETGATVPPSRWYSDQIAADYLFGGSPANPNLRFITSASAWWTADVAPYGRLGLTSFNTNVNGRVFRTLAGVTPQLGDRDTDWGILEWHPAAPVTPDLAVYRTDARLVELYRASLVVPIFWGDSFHQIQDSGFEAALRELVANAGNGPARPALELAPARLNFAVTRDGRATPAQMFQVRVLGRGRVGWTLASSDSAIAVSRPSGTATGDVEVSVAARDVGTTDRRVTLTVTAPDAFPTTSRVEILVRPIDGPGTEPHGSIDMPAEGATIASGWLDVAGWALDDVGVTKVEVWREPWAGEKASANGLIRLGDARFSRGTRPDVAALFPDAPMSDRAGWWAHVDVAAPVGVQPRTCRLHVLATDVEGHVKDLGVRTVTVGAR